MVEEAHANPVVSSCALPSEKMPVAASCSLRPAATLLAGAVRVIDCRTAAVTFSGVIPAIEPTVAVTLVAPGDLPVARPVAVSTEATAADDELQVRPVAITLDVPSV